MATDCTPKTLNLAFARDGAKPVAWPQDCGEIVLPPDDGRVPHIGFSRPPLVDRRCCASPAPEVSPHYTFVNQPPTVEAGTYNDFVLGGPTDFIELNGFATDDGIPHGTVSFLWEMVSGPTEVAFDDATAAVTNVHFFQAGTYVLRLRADDGEAAGTDTATIVVLQNEPPTVDAGPDGNIVLSGGEATFIPGASFSDDGLPGPTIVTWQQWGGPDGVTFDDVHNHLSAIHFTAPGFYLFMITADDGFATASDFLTVTVGDESALSLQLDFANWADFWTDSSELFPPGENPKRVFLWFKNGSDRHLVAQQTEDDAPIGLVDFGEAINSDSVVQSAEGPWEFFVTYAFNYISGGVRTVEVMANLVIEGTPFNASLIPLSPVVNDGAGYYYPDYPVIDPLPFSISSSFGSVINSAHMIQVTDLHAASIAAQLAFLPGPDA